MICGCFFGLFIWPDFAAKILMGRVAAYPPTKTVPTRKGQ